MGTLAFPDVPFSGSLYEDVEAFVTSLERGSPLLDFEELGRLARDARHSFRDRRAFESLRDTVRDVISRAVGNQRQDEYDRSRAGVS